MINLHFFFKLVKNIKQRASQRAKIPLFPNAINELYHISKLLINF